MRVILRDKPSDQVGMAFNSSSPIFQPYNSTIQSHFLWSIAGNIWNKKAENCYAA